MILDNFHHLLFSLFLILVLFDAMELDPRMWTKMVAASNQSLVEFTSTNTDEVMKLFALWFFGAATVLGMFSVAATNLYPNSVGASVLGSSFICFFLCLCSISMWQYRRPVMVEQLRSHVVSSAGTRFRLSLNVTVLGLAAAVVLLSIYGGPNMDASDVDFNKIILLAFAVGLTLFLSLFLIDAIIFAGLQLLILSPAMMVLVLFYGCVVIGKILLRAKWLPLKRGVLACVCGYTIYHLPWV